MRLYPERLSAHLNETLAPVYLISGDEPLQAQEARDLVVSHARQAGHETRQILEAGSGFEWSQLLAESAALSLFSERKILDIRIPNGKPGSEGSKALSAYCENPSPDTLLVLSTPRLEATQLKSKWFKAIDRLGVTVPIWPIPADRLPQWLAQRMRQSGLNATDEAVSILAQRIEGNLLAAQQEIDKLLLLHGPGDIDADSLLAAVSDSARYDAFDLVDSALRSETARCIQILEGLRAEGLAPAVVLWALHREVHCLVRIATDRARGTSLDNAVAQARVLRKRIPLVKHGVDNLRPVQWLGVLELCRTCDRCIKGVLRRDPWALLQDITLHMAGQPAVTTGGGK